MPDARVSNTITGRDAFLRVLSDEGVVKMFGNPGTTELPIMIRSPPARRWAMCWRSGSDRDRHGRRLCPRLGQAGLLQRPCRPRPRQSFGSIYTALMSGTPMIVTAGQQEQGHGLTEPLLYAPLVPIATPVVKWATEVNRIEDLPRILRRAAKVATTAPTGPVFISLPGDILNNEAALDMGEVTRVDTARASQRRRPRAARQASARGKKPVILAGHEIATSDAFAEAAALAEMLGAPVLQQTVVHGAHFPSEHPAFIGSLNRDQKHVRRVLSDYDLMFCVGSDVLKMSVWSEVEPLPETTRVAHVGRATGRWARTSRPRSPLRADVKETLKALVPVLKKLGGAAHAERAKASLAEIASRNWTAQRAARKAKLATPPADKPLPAEWLMMRLAEACRATPSSSTRA